MFCLALNQHIAQLSLVFVYLYQRHPLVHTHTHTQQLSEVEAGILVCFVHAVSPVPRTVPGALYRLHQYLLNHKPMEVPIQRL